MKRTLDIAAIVLTAFFLLALAAASLLGVTASIGFGMPVTDPAGALFYQVFASRNLVIVVAGAIFLILRLWKPLAILVTLTSALAVFDMSVLSAYGRTPPSFHAVTLGLILVTAALLWRRAVSAQA
jgi:hypothetical protein